MNMGTLVVVIIVLAVIGYAFLVFNRVNKPKPEIENENEPKSSPKLVTPETVVPGEHTVLKLTVDKSLRWHLELDGVQMDTPTDISAEQRQRLISAVSHIRPWVDGKNAPADTPLSASKPTLMPSESQSTAAQPALKIDALRGLRSLLNNEIKTSSDQKGSSIVRMIDEVLQAKLLGSALMEKSIRLEESSTGGVIVCVGTQKYTEIDAVPEPEIRDIIKASIAAWEKK